MSGPPLPDRRVGELALLAANIESSSARRLPVVWVAAKDLRALTDEVRSWRNERAPEEDDLRERLREAERVVRAVQRFKEETARLSESGCSECDWRTFAIREIERIAAEP